MKVRKEYGGVYDQERIWFGFDFDFILLDKIKRITPKLHNSVQWYNSLLKGIRQVVMILVRTY